MAQGKFKNKTKLLKDVQLKKTKKGSAVTKRANRPVPTKKKSHVEIHKLKQAVNKTVNKAVEEEIRARASKTDGLKLSHVQQAVAAHNKKTA